METSVAQRDFCFCYGVSRVKREAEGKLSRKHMVLLASTSDHVFTPIPPTGPAHRGLLQHCDVRALLRGIDAVGSQKGTGMRGALERPLSSLS